MTEPSGITYKTISNIYWGKALIFLIGIALSKYIKTERGIRQGTVFSPDLFNTYSEAILRELEISGFMIDETLDTSMSSAGKF